MTVVVTRVKLGDHLCHRVKFTALINQAKFFNVRTDEMQTVRYPDDIIEDRDLIIGDHVFCIFLVDHIRQECYLEEVYGD